MDSPWFRLHIKREKTENEYSIWVYAIWLTAIQLEIMRKKKESNRKWTARQVPSGISNNLVKSSVNFEHSFFFALFILIFMYEADVNGEWLWWKCKKNCILRYRYREWDEETNSDQDRQLSWQQHDRHLIASIQ